MTSRRSFFRRVAGLVGAGFMAPFLPTPKVLTQDMLNEYSAALEPTSIKVYEKLILFKRKKRAFHDDAISKAHEIAKGNTNA